MNDDNVEIDIEPPDEKPFPADWNKLGQHRLDATLDLLDRAGLTNRRPFTNLFGEIRESNIEKDTFEHEEQEIFALENRSYKSTLTITVRFNSLNQFGKEIRKIKDERSRLGGLKGGAARAKRLKEEAIRKLKEGICDHSGNKTGIFPCPKCRQNAKKYGIA